MVFIECSEDQFHFSKVNNNEFHHTILRKKTKLLAATKRNLGSENAFIEGLNNVLNDSDIPHTLALKNFMTLLTRNFYWTGPLSLDHFIPYIQF